MNKITLAALSAAFALAVPSADAQISVSDPSYGVATYYTHTNADSIVSFDFGANGGLYYQTVTSSFTFGGLYQHSGASTSAVVPGSAAQFSGASVVSIGQSIYYNLSDSGGNQLIYQYGPLNAPPVANRLASSSVNYSLAQNQGRLFITGAPNFGTNHIYYSGLNSDGSLANPSPAVDLGVDAGSSGPLAFDAAGDLFYAPGFGDQSIYRWSKLDVDNAIANPTANPLSALGHQWATYGGKYGNEDGGTSMLIDGKGNLLVTLTSFTNPSVLASFGIEADGSYNGLSDTILTSSTILGELRQQGTSIYLSDGNTIFQVVPEPSAFILVAIGSLAVVSVFRKRVA